jgi:hypothetical protein
MFTVKIAIVGCMSCEVSGDNEEAVIREINTVMPALVTHATKVSTAIESLSVQLGKIVETYMSVRDASPAVS